MNPESVLVIGSTSTVGHHVVSQLLASKSLHPVAASRDERKLVAFSQRGASIVRLDLGHIDSVKAAMLGIDRVFLLTGYTVDMVIQSKIVVDQAVRAGVKHIVHMGAWAPDDTDLGHFGWHQMVERYIEASGLTWTHVAPGMFMQNMLGGGTLWGAFGKGSGDESRPLHAFTGEGRLGWIAAEDIARACVTALANPVRHGGKKYDLSVEVRSVREIAELVEAELSTPFHAVVHDPELFYQALLTGGMEPTYAACARETLIRFGRGAIPGQDQSHPFESEFGFAPMDWREFARLHREEFLADQ